MVWHTHENEDEFFLVVKGQLLIHLRDRVINLTSGECFIVPQGVEHKTSAEEETHFMMIEPKATEHTGQVQSQQTVALEDQDRTNMRHQFRPGADSIILIQGQETGILGVKCRMTTAAP